MRQSTDRVLTTHAGSLPRPAHLLEAFRDKLQDKPVDADAFGDRLQQDVLASVQDQTAHGIDIVNDGEMGKAGFHIYALERLTGFEQHTGQPGKDPNAGSREHLAFPEYYLSEGGPGWLSSLRKEWVCTGPVTYAGRDFLRRDFDNLRSALASTPAAEGFLTAISPSNLARGRRNEYYPSEEEFLVAIADALHEEYQAIVDSGFLLQIDDPLLATYYTQHPELTVEEYRKWAWSHAELINYALRGIDPGRVRFHTCYSINIGPRLYDVELRHIVDIILSIGAGAYSFEAANPRHDHEWQVWESVALPEGKILIPGVITNSTVMIEHPALVAQRILRFAKLVGRENVIAGADCGFATVARPPDIPPSVMWAKFDALAQGAQTASRELWK
jgi:5-methyltetrahydropteroyltriglutamate--homocysteine methyltransferase